MKRSGAILCAMAVASTLACAAAAEPELLLNQVVKEGQSGYYDHHQGVVLSTGFWAQAGSDVTVTINSTPGFYLDKSQLDSGDKQYTSNAGRTFVVAGCVPMNVPAHGGLAGSAWVACNDLDFVKDKVEESAFISCLDVYRNGVLQELFIKEINNRTWESFRFSCGDLQSDGTVRGPLEKADFLFNFTRSGTLYATSVPTGHLTLGVFEIENLLQSRESLLTVALHHQSAQAIFDAGSRNHRADDIKLSPKVPPYTAQLTNFKEWFCPPGKVVTGAAIGHIPDGKGNDTRPVYILAECRNLLRNP